MVRWASDRLGPGRILLRAAWPRLLAVLEQPELLLRNIGTREIVVCNPLGEHLHASHAAWLVETS